MGKVLNLRHWQVSLRTEVAHRTREQCLICASEDHVSSFMLVVIEEIKTWNGCVV